MAKIITQNGEEVVLLDQQENLIELAKFCKLTGIADELLEQFSNPLNYKDLPFEDRMESCLETQISVNKINTISRLYRKSRLPRKVYLRQISVDAERGLERNDMQLLKELKYLDNCMNIIISGPTGVGKTALAIAAGLEVIQSGGTVLYYRFNELCVAIETKDNAQLIRFKESLRRAKLLIFDDYGLNQITDKVATGLNEIVDRHYGFGSIIVTTQLKREALASPLPEGIIRDALMDRLFRPSDKEIILKGTSWRGRSEEIRGEE